MQHQQERTVDGYEKGAGIKRKPVAAPASAHIADKEIHVTSFAVPREDTFATLPPRTTYPARPSIFARTQRKWSRLSKAVRIGVVVAVLLVLGLIIGLSAGLAGRSRTSNLPLPSNHGGPYSGDLTYYDPALGACGLTNSGADSICAVSHIVWDAVQIGANPNTNPLCGKKIRARRDGKSIDLTVVDRCTGCKPTDIDTTRSVFADMANIDQGRVNVEWSWLEAVPAAASA